VLSGVVAPVCGLAGDGLVLVPPAGFCSLIGWLLGDCACVSVLLLCAACATANVALSNAMVAIEASFFMVFSLWIQVAAFVRGASSPSWLPGKIASCRYNRPIPNSDGLH
jgi:hypothetical protein